MLTEQQSAFINRLDVQLQQLVELSYTLLYREKNSTEKFPDYSFIVFPAAKAYEGFLKIYLFDLQLISERTFEGKRLRIGRTLNPDVHVNQRDEYWLYDDLERLCSKELAQELWETWLQCRNKVFHFFPKDVSPLSLLQAEENLDRLQGAMTKALECRADHLRQQDNY